MVDSGSLENCCGRKSTVGSNPTSSASFIESYFEALIKHGGVCSCVFEHILGGSP